MADQQANQQSTVLVTGASGLVGTALVSALQAEGHPVMRAVRGEVQHPNEEVHWDPESGQVDRDKLTGVDAVVHLAGANIAGKRWTDAYKKEIRDSRVQGTRLIAETLAGLDPKPRVFACASAIGFYGDRGDAILDESAAPGEGFLPEVCLEWEQACLPAQEAGIRTVNLRFGVVLSKKGGALKEMLTPFKMGVGGVLGNGKQYMSWIVLDDAVRAIQFALENDTLAGPVNVVAPQAVTNREYTKTLGKVLGRPTIVRMPAFAARAAFGEMADDLLLASTRMVPERLQQAGFSFNFPDLEPALRRALEH